MTEPPLAPCCPLASGGKSPPSFWPGRGAGRQWGPDFVLMHAPSLCTLSDCLVGGVCSLHICPLQKRPGTACSCRPQKESSLNYFPSWKGEQIAPRYWIHITSVCDSIRACIWRYGAASSLSFPFLMMTKIARDLYWQRELPVKMSQGWAFLVAVPETHLKKKKKEKGRKETKPLTSNFMANSKNIILPTLLQAWKSWIFLIHLQWVNSRQGNFLHRMSHFNSKTLINVKRAAIPAETQQSICGVLLAQLPAVGERGQLQGHNWKALTARTHCQDRGKISYPLFTNSLWEPACGNKLVLFAGIVLEESFCWSLEKLDRKNLFLSHSTYSRCLVSYVRLAGNL